MDTIREDVAHTIFKVSLVKKEAPGAGARPIAPGGGSAAASAQPGGKARACHGCLLFADG